jgi:HAE1 family hydrophobic/amphiphilic exporter-1
VFGFLPRLAVERPVLTSMLVVMSLVLGLFGFTRLQTDLFPEVEFPVVTVTTVYPGAGPEEIETQVTDRLEEAIASLAGIDLMRSFSQENVSIIIVQFELGISPDQAAIDVRDRVETARARLPSAAESPTVQKFDLGALPIITLALAGPQGADALYELADLELRERLSRVRGVASVQIVGGRQREVEVLARPERLDAFGLTLGDFAQFLQAENLSIPSGRISQPDLEFPLRVVGEYRTVRDIEDLRLPLPEGRVIRLAEVAEVRDGYEDLRQVARLDREPAISMTIQKRSDANPVETAAAVNQELERIRAELPPGARLEVVLDQTEFIRDAIRDVLSNLVLGILLTTVVLFLFLHSWRGTIIAAAAMPVTIVSAFLLMDLAGFTLNMMTLMALSITVGILVTNTIVVLENIYRRLGRGESPAAAAREGTSEVAVAVAASTLTNLVVFTPIAFMGGLIGQFFQAFGLTVVFATVYSIFISFTLAPLLAARLLRRDETASGQAGALGGLWRRWEAGFAGLERTYRGALGWALDRPVHGWAVIGGTFVLSIVALLVAGRFVGGEFMPRADEGAIRITLELPPGTPPERTAALAAEAEAMLAGLPEVETMLMTVTGAGGDFMGVGGGTNLAEILVILRHDARPTDAVVRRIRPMLAELPEAAITAMTTNPSEIGGDQAPVQLLITGPDYAALAEIGERVTGELSRLPQLSDVVNSLEASRTELVVRPSRPMLADHGTTVAQVGQWLRASIEGTIAGVFRGEIGREREIRVRLAPEARERPEQVAQLLVRTGRGVVPLGALGEIERAESPTTIQRVDRVRTVQIDAQIGQGSLTDAIAALQGVMDATPLPPGYEWRITGDFEMFEEALGTMLVALVLAITLTYIVLAMILESFIHPVTIMVTLPLGAVGALLALFLGAASINIFSMMAIIMLVGIVVNNAILILDYAAQLRARGMAMVPALLEAAPARLRPIVMSNTAIVIALIPQAVAGGAGAVFRVPMAVVTMGGVLLSAVFTLLLIPVIYTKFERLVGRREGA